MAVIDPNLLNLVRSLKPYMGRRALKCTEMAEALLEVLETESARKAQAAFKALRQREEEVKVLPMQPHTGPETGG